jgi:hypothetical protein
MIRFHHSLTFLLLFCSSFALGQENTPRLHLKTGLQPVPVLTAELVDSFNRVLPRAEGKAYLVVSFLSLPGAGQRKILEQQGVELIQYLPDLSYTATVRLPLNKNSLQQAGVFGLFALRPIQKIDPLLLRPQLPAWAVRNAGTVNLLVVVTKTMTVSSAIAGLTERGYRITTLELQGMHVIGVQSGITRLQELAGLPFIEYVQPEPPAPQSLNFNNRSGSRGNVLNAPILQGGKGLNGEGVVLGIGDDADVQTHVDFTNRLINRAVIGVSNHGYHTTGTLGGAGIVNELYRGFAPKATIISYFYSGILTNAATQYADYGMVITNNSYGNIVECDYHGLYDIYAQQLDQQAYDLPELMHVFAAGNSGASTCSPFPARYHTVLGGYQCAKNVVTVGATSDSGLISSFSSRGPVKDGRVKPEIVTQGQSVISTIAGNTYGSNQGTSMSAPAVAGGMGLLVQRYRQLNGNANPKGALIKALLCNGASDKGAAGPDFDYGYGWMNLLRSVEMLDSGHYISGNVLPAATNTHTITVPANTSQLKVMLYWHDPAASLVSSQTLVNDIDLEVVDLATNTVLPYRIDTARGNLGSPVFTGADHINNMEQVVIDPAPAGNYTVRVKGTSITQNGSQDYFVAWDPLPISVQLTNPVGGEGWAPGDIVKLNWEAYGNPSSTFTLEYTTNNGSSWNTIASGLNGARRIYTWTVPSVASGQAKVRITQSGTGSTSTSNSFGIMTIPTATMAATASQCEGYINFSWTSVTGATDYEVMLLRGDEMVAVLDTVSTSCILKNFSKDTTYWVAVRARISGQPGRRSLAISRMPNNGSCTGSMSDGDLSLYAVSGPVNGRMNTSSALSSTTILSVQVKNLDDVAITGFDMKYRVNGGSWIVEPVSATINAGATYNYNFSTRINMASAASYVINVVVKNQGSDPITSNDTLTVTVKQLANDIVSLPFSDDLETLTSTSYKFDQTGLEGGDHFDFLRNTPYARLRPFVNSGFAFSGTHAITLDMDRSSGGTNTNYLTGTYNFSTSNASSNDVRLGFSYRGHGQVSNSANKVWIRGNDGAAWVEVFDLDDNQGDAGSGVVVKGVEVARLLNAAGQNFSSSFQVRWGQYGSYQAVDLYGGAGYTFDDIKLSEAIDDIQVQSVVEPASNSCALSSTTQITIRLRNGSFGTLDTIPVKYRIDGGSWVSETYNGTLTSGSVDDYMFTALANLSAFGTHTIQAVADYPTDNEHDNDTLTLTVVNQPVVSSFPYLQNFESGAGYWYSGGRNSSWALGTPASPIMNDAASGVNAWKTRLAGNYNDRELSYLYSPCFNISGLTTPTLSFSLALDLEDCGGSTCDAAWVEYSEDGITWTKLGTNGSGTNWYNKAANLWSRQSYGVWRVASFALPTGGSELRLRFVMLSDESTSREGIAIDDIHIYDDAGLYTGPTLSAPLVQPVSGSSWVDFTSGGNLLVSINANSLNLGNTAVQVFIDTTTSHYNTYQYYLGRSFTIKPANRNLADSVTVRLYFSERESELLLASTGCNACYKPATAFSIGVSKYNDSDTSLEDNNLANNLTGAWNFYTGAGRTIVPYDKGYYAEFKVKDFSEFWFNSGGEFSSPLPVRFISFTAKRREEASRLDWTIGFEENVTRYDIEVAQGDEALRRGQFVVVGQVAALGNTNTSRSYRFEDLRLNKSGTYYYRIRVRNTDGSTQLSAIRPVLFSNDYRWFVYPNPSEKTFHLAFRSAEGDQIRFRLYDAQGRQLKDWSQRATGFVEKTTLDLEGYSPGMYLLRADGAAGTESFRLYKK